MFGVWVNFTRLGKKPSHRTTISSISPKSLKHHRLNDFPTPFVSKFWEADFAFNLKADIIRDCTLKGKHRPSFRSRDSLWPAHYSCTTVERRYTNLYIYIFEYTELWLTRPRPSYGTQRMTTTMTMTTFFGLDNRFGCCDKSWLARGQWCISGQEKRVVITVGRDLILLSCY